MANNIDEFIAKYKLEREFGGQGQALIEAAGAHDLDGLLEVEREEDLDDVKKAGFKVLHVKRLLKAIIAERQSRSTTAVLEKALSTLVEDVVKEPRPYVATSDIRVHKQKEPVALPDPIGRGPLFARRAEPAKATEPEVQAPFDVRQAFGDDAPALPTPGKKAASAVAAEKAGSGRAATQRQLQEQERRKAEAEATARNAGLASDMVHGDKVGLPSEMFDRTLDFVWSRQVRKVDRGKIEFEDSPILKLTESKFKEEFLASLKTFCDGYEAWELPEIDCWLSYEPDPPRGYYGGLPDPHVMITFAHVEDAAGIRQGFRDFQDDPVGCTFMQILGQHIRVERPDPRKVARLASERGSDTASQAGSLNSHSSRARGHSHRNLTVLFQNIPENLAKSDCDRPQIMSKINTYIEQVLAANGGMPIDKRAIKISSSFSQPRRAPPGAVWVTFSYALEHHRINTLGSKFDDGKAYTFEAFVKAYRASGMPDKSDADLQGAWIRCEDAVTAAEKLLGGGQPLSIASFFMNRVKAADKLKRDATLAKIVRREDWDISLEERLKYIEGDTGNVKKTWTECIIGGNILSVEFMRLRR